MEEYISRQAAIDAVRQFYDEFSDNEKSIEEIIAELPSAQPAPAFITWLLDEIWDEDMWELNWQTFPEILCRKMAKFGYIRERNGEYERLDQ